MKTLEQILQEINLAPTVMDLSLEQEFCRELVRHDLGSIDGKWDVLFRIFNRLQESHADSFYEMDSGDDFFYFVNWLQDLANVVTNPAVVDGLASVVSMFSIKAGE